MGPDGGASIGWGQDEKFPVKFAVGVAFRCCFNIHDIRDFDCLKSNGDVS